MLSFSVIICYSAVEIGLYSLYRKSVRSRYVFPRNNDDLSLASQIVEKKPPFCMCCVYAGARW